MVQAEATVVRGVVVLLVKAEVEVLMVHLVTHIVLYVGDKVNSLADNKWTTTTVPYPH